MKRIAAIIMLCLTLVSCAPPSTVEAEPVQVNSENGGRVVVVSTSRFTDAQWKVRDILVLRDTETGFEFIAVMGAGVVQIEQQKCGKSTCEVENP